ncbi:hypothetical protein Hanom_Chr16g01515931 [Helianthus anomalus]
MLIKTDKWIWLETYHMMLAKILNGPIVYQIRGFVSQPFQKWFDDVMAAGLMEPNAMELCPSVSLELFHLSNL